MKAKNLIILITLFTVMAITGGCGLPESYGGRITNRNITSIKDILLHPAVYNGKVVTVKGKIAIECETGCWFNFKEKEGDAIIYVDLEPSGFAISQKAGRNATVEGKVAIKNGKPILIGKGVEIR